jgi:hypothetical protein
MDKLSTTRAGFLLPIFFISRPLALFTLLPSMGGLVLMVAGR